jgi:hypothetical protein
MAREIAADDNEAALEWFVAVFQVHGAGAEAPA